MAGRGDSQRYGVTSRIVAYRSQGPDRPLPRDEIAFTKPGAVQGRCDGEGKAGFHAFPGVA